MCGLVNGANRLVICGVVRVRCFQQCCISASVVLVGCTVHCVVNGVINRCGRFRATVAKAAVASLRLNVELSLRRLCQVALFP